MKSSKIFCLIILMLFVTTIAMPLQQATAVEEMTRENTLVYTDTALRANTGFWNPLNPKQGSQAVSKHLPGMLEPLYIFDSLNYALYPWIASGPPRWISAVTLEVKLRDAYWQDNVSLTAEDVKYTFELGKNVVGTGFSKDVWATLVSIDVVDESTVRFTLNATKNLKGILLNALATTMILPKHIFEAAEDQYSTLLDFPFDPPIGSGPYKFTRWDTQTIVKTRWDEWWGKAYFGKVPDPKFLVFIQGTSNEEALRLMIAGDADLSQLMSPGMKDWIKYDIRSWYLQAPFVKDLPFRIGGYLTNNERWNTRFGEDAAYTIKLAIAYAINRTQVCSNSFFSVAVPMSDPTFIPATSPLAFLRSSNVVNNYTFTYDPERAKTILNEANIIDYDGDGIRELSDTTTKITLDMYCVEGWTDWMGATEMFKSFMANIGIKVDTHYIDSTSYNDAHRSGKVDVSPYQTSIWSIAGIWPFLGIFDDRYTSSPMLTGTPFYYHNEQIYTLRDQIAQYDNPFNTTQQTQLKILAAQVQEILAEDLPFIPVWYWGDPQFYSTRYWTDWPTQENPYVPLRGVYDPGLLIALLKIRSTAKEIVPTVPTELMPAIYTLTNMTSLLSTRVNDMASTIVGLQSTITTLQTTIAALICIQILLTAVVLFVVIRQGKRE